MRSAVIAGVALVALTLPSLAQNTNPTQPGTATPPAAQPQTPPTVPTSPSPPAAQTAPSSPTMTPPAAAQPASPPAAQQRITPPAAPVAQQGEPARMAGSHLIGLTLRNTANESIGEINDVIVDRDGRVREVVVGVGGFLGIGEHKVAISWDQLNFDATRDVAVVNMTKDQLRAMPEYRADTLRNNTAPATSANPPAALPRANPAPSTPPAPGGTTPPARSP